MAESKEKIVDPKVDLNEMKDSKSSTYDEKYKPSTGDAGFGVDVGDIDRSKYVND